MFVAVVSAARGAERATLANGFSIDCIHHQTFNGTTRLYTSTDASSYIDFPSEQISRIEQVPDPTMNPTGEIPTSQNISTGSLTKADLDQLLSRAGETHNLDMDLLASVVKAESGGNAHARSRAGAQGLMQLMPGTAAELGVRDSYRPDQNVNGGSAYLDALLTRYHENLSLALAAYNAGPAAVDRYHGIPPYRETRLYVARVIHEFNRRVRMRERGSEKAAAASLAEATR